MSTCGIVDQNGEREEVGMALEAVRKWVKRERRIGELIIHTALIQNAPRYLSPSSSSPPSSSMRNCGGGMSVHQKRGVLEIVHALMKWKLEMENESEIVKCAIQLEEEANRVMSLEERREEEEDDEMREWEEIGEIASNIFRLSEQKEKRKKGEKIETLAEREERERQHIRELEEKNRMLEENRRMLEDKNRVIGEKDRMLGEKDRVISENQRVIGEKDRQLEAKERELSETKTQLIQIKKVHEPNPVPFTIKNVGGSVAINGHNISKSKDGEGTALISPIITSGIVSMKVKIVKKNENYYHGMHHCSV